MDVEIQIFFRKFLRAPSCTTGLHCSQMRLFVRRVIANDAYIIVRSDLVQSNMSVKRDHEMHYITAQRGLMWAEVELDSSVHACLI